MAGTALWDACCALAWQVLGFGSAMAVLRGPAMRAHTAHSQHDRQHEHFSEKVLLLRVVLTVWRVCVACELHGRGTQ